MLSWESAIDKAAIIGLPRGVGASEDQYFGCHTGPHL